MELDSVKQVPTIVAEIAEGKKISAPTIETGIEKAYKRIKLLL